MVTSEMSGFPLGINPEPLDQAAAAHATVVALAQDRATLRAENQQLRLMLAALASQRPDRTLVIGQRELDGIGFDHRLEVWRDVYNRCIRCRVLREG